MKIVINLALITAILVFAFQLDMTHLEVKAEDLPLALKVVAPHFPEGARDARASGITKIAVKIDTKGNVISARFDEGNKFFGVVSENSAKKWVFESSTKETRETTITFVFTLLPENSTFDEEVTIFTMPNTVEIRSDYAKAKQIISK